MKILHYSIKTSLVLLLLFYAAPLLAEVSVQTRLTPSSFSVQQYGQLTITVNGGKNVHFTLPEVKGLTIIERGKSKNIQMINGDVSILQTTTCIVQAAAPGKYTIPSFPITTKEKTLDTRPISFTVTGSAQTGNTTSQNALHNATHTEASLHLNNLDGEHYVGEIIPVTIEAWFPQQLKIGEISYPQFNGDGFVVPEIKTQPQQTRKIINGRPFIVLTWETALTPIKEGNQSITVAMEAVQLISQRRNPASSFGSQFPFNDNLFDDFFGTTVRKRIVIRSTPQSSTIRPLPTEKRPENFTGTVGNFTLKTSIDRTQAEVGEPLTLKITIAGTGNIDGIEPPVFPASQSWKAYTPTLVSTEKDGNTGKKIYEQAIVAKKNSVTTVPPLAFSFFDPKKKQYATVESALLSVAINSAATLAPIPATPATPNVTAKSHTAPPPVAAGPPPLQYQLGKAEDAITPLFRRSIYQIPALVLCCLLGIVLAIHLQRWRNQNKPIDRSAERRKNLALALADIRTTSDHKDGRQFLAALRILIQEQLGSLWNCTPETITLATLKQRLGKEKDSSPLIAIYQNAEQAAYGGQTPDTQSLNEMLEIVKKELEELI